MPKLWASFYLEKAVSFRNTLDRGIRNMDVISYETKLVTSPSLSDYADYRIYLKDFYRNKNKGI